jgi:hypothetical protein
MKRLKKILQEILIIAMIFIIAMSTYGQAVAATLTYKLNTLLSGTSSSNSISANFDDSFGYANTVRLFMDAGDLSATEGVLQWYFNFDPSETASSLDLNYVSGAVAATKINQDNLKAGGDGYFDFAFRFNDEPTGLGPDSNNLISVYDITYTSAISVYDFDFFSAPNNGAGTGLYISVAQVNDINGDDADSGWVGSTSVVPEPISSILFVVGSVTLGLRCFRKKFK